MVCPLSVDRRLPECLSGNLWCKVSIVVNERFPKQITPIAVIYKS